MKRYVGYVRVSSESQRHNTSSDDQAKVIEEYCIKENIELVHIFKDLAKSGKDTEHREQYNEMISFILDPANEIDGVITKKTDRLHRKVANLLYFCETIMKGKNEAGKKIRDEMNYISVTDRIDISTPEGKNWIVFLGWMAEKEREAILERTRSGRRNTAIDKGKYAGGKVPYGYKVREKKIVLDEEESQIVKEVFDWYIEGKTPYWIKTKLNKLKETDPMYRTRTEKTLAQLTPEELETRKRKTAKGWHESNIFSILRNEAYLGIYVYDGVVEQNGVMIKDDVIPRLISTQTWNKARKRDKDLKQGDFTRKRPKVVAYVRSSLYDDVGYIKQQIEAMQKACEELKYELVSLFVDEGIDGDDLNRDGYLQMLSYVNNKQNKVKGMLCYNIFALHEEYDHYLDMMDFEFPTLDKKPFLLSVSEKIDSTTEEGNDEFGKLISKAKRVKRKKQQAMVKKSKAVIE